MSGQTVILEGSGSRATAHRLIDAAPAGSVLNVKAPKRTLDQNALMWSRLSDISRAKPEGRMHTPDVWKCIMMNACGHQVQFVPGLDGEMFPIGFKSSRLSKDQMTKLLDFIDWYAAEHGVSWSWESAA